MKYIWLFLFLFTTISTFSQNIDFRGRTMILKDPLPQNIVIEVSDTLMNKVEVIRHDNGANKVQGFIFGYNDAGLFQSIKANGEKIPIDHLKKALNGKTNKIYFNNMEIKYGFKTIKLSFILRIIYH